MRKNLLTIYNLAAVCAFCAIMMFMPWVELQGYEFIDRMQYFNYFTYGKNVLEYREFFSPIDYAKNEALWHYLIPLLHERAGLELETIFNLIGLICLVTFGYFVVARHGPLAIILLFNPLLVTLAFDQLRSALAYSMLLLAYMLRQRWVIIFLLLPAVFLHTSTIIFICVYIFIWIFNKLKSHFLTNSFVIFLCCFAAGATISIAIGPLRDQLLGAIGDRRAEYGDASSSVLYTLFWVGMLGLSAFQRPSFYKDEINRYTIVILSLVSCNLLTGGYTTRFLALSLPLLMCSILRMDKDKMRLCLFFYLAYVIAQWWYWLKLFA